MKKLKKCAQNIVVLSFAFLLIAAPVFAIKFPPPTEAFYVNDYAGVLSAENVKYMAARSAALADSTGAELVIVTVDFLDGNRIDDYSIGLFNEWALGDKNKNNGLLLLLAIGEEDYYYVLGSGLDVYLSAGTVGEYVNSLLEPDFAVGNYDAGVRKVYDKLFSKLESIYGAASTVPSTNAAPNNPTTQQKTRGTGMAGMISTLLIIFIIIVAINALLGSLFMSYNRRRYPMMPPVYRPRWYNPFWGWGRPYHHHHYNSYYPPRGTGGYGYGYGGNNAGPSVAPPPSNSGGSGSFWGRSSTSGGGSTRGSGGGRSSTGGSVWGSGSSSSGSGGFQTGSSSGKSSGFGRNSSSSNHSGGSSFGGSSFGGSSFGGSSGGRSSSFGGSSGGRSSSFGGGSAGKGGGRGGRH